MTRLLLSMLLLACAAVTQAQTLKIATVAPEGSGWMREMRAAAKAVAEATDGRVNIRYYPGGVMGDDATVLRKVRLGQLQGGAFTSSGMTVVFPDAVIYGLPFMFREQSEIDAVRAKVDPSLERGMVEAGWQPLGITGIGFAYLMSSGPIDSREALQKRKVWVPQNDVIAEETFRAGGIAPIPLPLPDVFTALQTGMVDTIGNTPAGAIALQWHGKLRQLLDLPLAYVVGIVAVDRRAWQKLSEADRAVTLRLFREASERIDAENQRADREALAALQQLGVKVVEPSPEVVARWTAIGEDIADKLVASGDITAERLAEVRAALEAHRAATR